MITDAALDGRLEAWARWCRGRPGHVNLGYPSQSPEQSAINGSKSKGLVIPFDAELEIEVIVAQMAMQSPLHARVIRVEYGAAPDCGWDTNYDQPRQEFNARRVGVTLARYRQVYREAKQMVKFGVNLRMAPRNPELATN